MGVIQKTTVVIILLNLFLYPFVIAAPADYSAAKDQITGTVGKFANIEDESGTINGTAATKAMPTSLQEDTVESGGGLTAIVSGLKTALDFLIFMMGIIGNVYILMVKVGIPWLPSLFIGLPLIVVQIIGIVSAFRGYDI